ncbi:hypothetical protein [Neptuniibacter sp.]|uniref:hypothetical protein n=1 Tax=Neptuniibacter sp. TaxID=1962643 RepID=UPI00260C72AA|nr:hypothetical protein [Neptuniibacter sp.]MCP4595063.1 hypothetical protein [Neptuniibacter sp.]
MTTRVKHPYIIDVEASGFGPDSYPIEVGVAMEEGKRYCSLIHPERSWTHWCDDAERYHQIPRSSLLLHGKQAVIVAETLNLLLEGQTVYSDGWVVDKPWLIKLFNKARVPMEFTVSPLEMILREPQMEIWHEVKDQIERELMIERHRASNDALIIQKTYQRTLEMTEGVSL